MRGKGLISMPAPPTTRQDKGLEGVGYYGKGLTSMPAPPPDNPLRYLTDHLIETIHGPQWIYIGGCWHSRHHHAATPYIAETSWLMLDVLSCDMRLRWSVPQVIQRGPPFRDSLHG